MKGRKTGGRLRGTPNKVSSEMRKRIMRVLDAIDVEAELQTLNAHERVKLWLNLVEYIVPKMERSNPIVEANLEELKAEFQKLKQLNPNEVKNNIQNPNRDTEIRPERNAQTHEDPKGIVGDGIPEIRA